MNFKDLSIKRKITYLFLPLAIIPIIIFALMSTYLYEASIVDRSLLSMEDNNKLVADRIDDILAEAESGTTFLTISINSLLNNDYQGELEDDIKQYNLISNELSYAKLIYKEIDSISFYDKDERLYYTDALLQQSKEEINSSDMFRILKQSTGNMIWFDLSKRSFLTTDLDEPLVTLGKKVWNINTGETIGYLFINIKEETFVEVFKNQISDYYIFDNRNKVLTTYLFDESIKLESKEHLSFIKNESIQSNVIKSGGHKMLVSKIEVDRVKWILLSQTNIKNLTQDLTNLLIIVTIMVLVIIMVDILISFALNGLITNPIMSLKGGIEEISKGNFDYRFKIKTNDEIGLFANSFNHMSEQIKQLINRVEKEEKRKRAFELALIQQQIKPHFLYNSLDIILKLSQLGQSRKAQKVTMRLADYYKHSLSGGSDIVQVTDEIQITKDYLELQKIRYSDILDYKIDVSEELSNWFIPKLTLQPLVENAIYHGLKNKTEAGMIHIYDEMRGQTQYLVVADNGIGMNQDVYNRLTSHLEKNLFNHTNNMNESFGMRNVHHRLRLFLGMSYGLSIETSPGIGTKILIELPKDGLND